MDTNRRERFKRLFLAHYSRLCGVAYGFVADGEDVEDIVQELFITVWDKGKDSLSDKEFAAYMTVAVRNSCISFLRKKQEGAVSIDDHPAAASCLSDDLTDGDEPTPEERLQAALRVLPPRCRDIFLMSKLKGMKYCDIAAALDISEKTVENQMTKAVKLLRAYVASGGPLLIVVITIVLSIIANCG
ncbi:RNA polymerase sigma-70 factor [uncultured Bacteroides sp.]|uniref:RNA polymerase sigma-70 factor n=1 Tax=uncultured Bacteroides sp. TaxID=162156 RepID=UPI00260554FA|nr:RNA polymerase sigma-70 factor [uncultured Bacteroides sp.]